MLVMFDGAKLRQKEPDCNFLRLIYTKHLESIMKYLIFYRLPDNMDIWCFDILYNKVNYLKNGHN